MRKVEEIDRGVIADRGGDGKCHGTIAKVSYSLERPALISHVGQLEIRPVQSRREQSDFYRVRCEVYRNDPAAARPLQSLDWLPLDTHRHPFYEHAKRQVWVAYRQGRPVGRIAAILDHLFTEYYATSPEHQHMGFVGFFESPYDPTISRSLFEVAFAWLQSQGCRRVRGPVNPSMKGEFGVLLEGHDHSPFLMMAHTPAYYHDLFVQAGFRPQKKFYSFLFEHAHDSAGMQEKYRELQQCCQRLQKRFPELEIRSATKQTLEPMLREINRIGNRIRSQGWGFVPLTPAELEFMVKQVRRIIRPETVIGCYWKDQLVGYNVTLPNINWALRRARGRWDWWRLPQLLYWMKRIPEGRLIAVGVDPDIRAKGMAALLTKAMLDQSQMFERWEFGWIAEDNLLSMAALSRAVPMRRYKTYQVYEREL